MALRLRSARVAEAPALAALHVASWRDTYREALDPAFLAGPVEEVLQAHWAEALARRPRQGAVILATAGGDLAGFVAAWREGEECRVESLHVRPGMRGAGIGRALLGFAAGRMATMGCVSAKLEVLACNAGALRFYTALGAQLEPEHEGEVFGQVVMERELRWPDIATLIKACATPRAG